jgi:hypothetical protein
MQDLQDIDLDNAEKLLKRKNDDHSPKKDKKHRRHKHRQSRSRSKSRRSHKRDSRKENGRKERDTQELADIDNEEAARI